MPSSASRKKAEPSSSRKSREAAGWLCTTKADPAGLYRPGRKRKQFSWISPRPLWESRNDKIARWFGDPTDGERKRWVAAQLRKGIDPAFTITKYADRDEVSFFVLGDPGEGDDSQYHVLRPLQARSEGIDFTYIVSDVIYPAGDALDYHDNFFWPYRNLPGPIYAIPGNHDWYDGLHGFMTLLCGADPDLRPPARLEKHLGKRAFLDLTWREPSEVMQDELEAMQKLRPEPSGQPASYFAIELKEVVLVGLDTGIQAEIDKDQGDWLKKISKLSKDKILLTGKPLIVDASKKTTKIAGSKEDTVNAIVEDPANRYIAVIGGDIHNFQRYPAQQADGRVVQHIISGAAGAYTKATHKIEKATLDRCGCEEKDFRCYPRRGDSLAAYSILLDRKIPLNVAIPYEVAPAVMSLRLEGVVDPSRIEDRDVQIPKEVWRAAKIVFPFSDAGIMGPFNKNFSEFLDWNDPDPPLFKSFLRVDTRPGEVEFRCFAATGCEEHADDPPLEDWIKGTRGDNGQWTWEVLLD